MELEQVEPQPSAAPGVSTTRDRLLDAAEREFALRGFRGASVRRITAGAGLSQGNVRRLFGSKQGLLGAVYRRLLDPLTAERLASLDALLERTPNPSVIETFDALSGPVVRFLTHPAGAQRGLFGLRGVFEPDVFWPYLKATSDQIGDRYLACFERALPDVSRGEVSTRLVLAARFFFHGLTPGFQHTGDPQPVTDEEILMMRRHAIAILTDPLRREPCLNENPWARS